MEAASALGNNPLYEKLKKVVFETIPEEKYTTYELLLPPPEGSRGVKRERE